MCNKSGCHWITFKPHEGQIILAGSRQSFKGKRSSLKAWDHIGDWALRPNLQRLATYPPQCGPLWYIPLSLSICRNSLWVLNYCRPSRHRPACLVRKCTSSISVRHCVPAISPSTLNILRIQFIPANVSEQGCFYQHVFRGLLLARSRSRTVTVTVTVTEYLSWFLATSYGGNPRPSFTQHYSLQ